MTLEIGLQPWRIVATLGPSSSDPEVLRKLLRAGVNVARFNFSHGSHESHALLLESLRTVAEEEELPVAALQDLQGHKVRVGDGGPVTLEVGKEILLGSGATISPERIGVDYEDVTDYFAPGQCVYLDDGFLLLECTDRSGDDLVCTVLIGGELLARKGATFPDGNLPFPLLNEKDIVDARFGVEIGMDMVAMSFVRSAEEIEEMRAQIGAMGKSDAFIAAKIEDAAGVANLDEILEVADAVLIARGDLGVTLPREHVPGIQKDIIRSANARGVAVITATQMLESMRHVVQPTRAEVNDVHNAILDGSDAVMLSGETASGEYPVRAVEEMQRICRAAEEYRRRAPRVPLGGGPHKDLHAPVAEAATRMAHDVGARAILAFSYGGRIARALSAARPRTPVYCVVADEELRRRLQLHWGLNVITLPETQSLPKLVEVSVERLLASGACARGDRLIVVAGTRQRGGADSPLLRIHEVERDST